MSQAEDYYFEPLSIGSIGAIVLMVQKTLNSIGYELESNGVFDEEMDAVVRNFQEEHLLPLDGRVGVETIEELDRLFALSR